MARPRTGCLSALAVGIFLIAWVGSIFWTAVDEGAVPPDSAFPAVPLPSKAGGISTQCGSGGCWREMDIRTRPPQTVESLRFEMGLDSERCEPLNLWTLRKACTGVSNDLGELKIYVRYSLVLSKY